MSIQKKTNIAQKALSLIFTVVTVLALLLSLVSALLALIFISNFNFSNTWHFFVFWFTLSSPFVSLTGYLSSRSSHKPILRFAAILAAFSPFFIPLIWSFEASKGLAH
jgi:hypothetical protein